MNTKLYLMSDGDAYENSAPSFVEAAGGENAVIALLLHSPEVERLLGFYGPPLEAAGVKKILPVGPDAFGKLDSHALMDALDAATAVMVGGGDTEIYWRLYTLDLVGAELRSRVQAGMVYGGLSAGADIATQICAVAPEDTADGAAMIKQGLNLLPGCLTISHFEPEKSLPFTVEAMQVSGVSRAWGLSEEATAVFVDGRLAETIGPPVHLVELLDRESGAHHLTELTEENGG
jgi:cyanophycinase